MKENKLNIDSELQDILDTAEKEWDKFNIITKNLSQTLPKEEYLLQIKMNWMYLQSLDEKERKQYLSERKKAIELMKTKVDEKIEKIKNNKETQNDKEIKN